MRFAFAGCDRNLKLFEMLTLAGWQAVKLFSVPEINQLSSNKALLAQAQKMKLPIQLSRMQVSDLAALKELGCDVIVIASYNWRIPDWQGYVPYAINFHPSPLPIGRGPYPLVRAILEQHQSWAVSCHRIAHEYDAGPVLGREEFLLDEYDTHDTLNLKLQMAGGRLATRIAHDFQHCWDNAQTQTAALYWPLMTDADKTIDFFQSVFVARTQLRAFAGLECLAYLNGQKLGIRSGHAWPEKHAYFCGQIAHVNGNTLVIACTDGLLALTDWYAVNN
ncbi:MULTISPECIES: formyltransferase family protein [unclassified Undibacterium]|uniref:formyltransferase family protein n=1 Tax=unclassified Undibacterium TaxID=2630295 RepID=UPI002AC91FCB|nr:MULTISPECIES: formyltransferase family protein [unclassified Undibacterium]MEB0138607.1 formyltransferase family protein [Undibacterium sp. CCC2.1]MEB0171408.1 formyltransferase family protein [Undibacterium sp. CCC1.1]MEB0175738.1 formyltransferase family protein [Undibacterium sp. CCC3.4]MEB0214434.1 formyltransferase family protein [Undibacterium sp. 5I2]WPX44299.1 formyltransferase family protein [Undibacterium sp. CCC3.4]